MIRDARPSRLDPPKAKAKPRKESPRDAAVLLPSSLDAIERGKSYSVEKVGGYYGMTRRSVVEMLTSGEWQGRMIQKGVWSISGDSIVDWTEQPSKK